MGEMDILISGILCPLCFSSAKVTTNTAGCEQAFGASVKIGWSID
jgi:hypothetical protein